MSSCNFLNSALARADAHHDYALLRLVVVRERLDDHRVGLQPLLVPRRRRAQRRVGEIEVIRERLARETAARDELLWALLGAHADWVLGVHVDWLLRCGLD